VDADGRVAWVNDALVDVTGFDREALVGERPSKPVAEGDASELSAVVRALAAGDETGVTSLAVALATADGDRLAADVRLRAVETGGGGPDAASRPVVGVVNERDRALQQEGERFRSLVQEVKDYAIFMLDEDGRVATWNEGAERIKGYDREEVLGEHFSRFYTDEDREAGVPAENLERATANGRVEDEGWRVRADGSRFWANVVITALHDDDGDLSGYAKVTRDATERREREQALRRERDLTEGVLETSPVSVVVVNRDGEVVKSNSRAKRRFAIPEGDESYSIGDHPIYDEDGEFVPPENRPYADVLETGEPVTDWQCQIETAAGERRWISVNAAPLPGDENLLVVTGEDVTDLKLTERRLARRRDELESELGELFGRITDAFFALDDDWNFTYVNERAEELLDSSETELLDSSVWEAFPAAAGTTFQAKYERAMAEQEPVVFEEFFEPLNTWFHVSAHPSETGLSVYFRDVTDRKQHEQTLAGLHGVTQDLPHAETKAEVAERVVGAASDLLGLPGVTLYVHDEAADELYPAAYADDMPDRYGELPRVEATPDGSVTAKAFVEGETVEYDDVTQSDLLLNEDASVRRTLFVPLGDHGLLVVGDEGTDAFDDDTVELAELLAASAESAMDRVDREAALRERERELERYETIVETVNDGIYALDEDAEFVMVNDAFLEMTNWERDDLLGRPAETVHSEALGSTAGEMAAEVLAGEREVGVLEHDLRTRDGDTVPVESRFGPYSYTQEEYGRCGVVRDVSDRLARERELRDRMRQQQVTADLGRLALEEPNLDRLFEEATERVADVLGNEYCEMLDLDENAGELLLRQGVGWQDGCVGEATVAADENSQAGYTLQSEEPVVVADMDAQTRFSGPDLLLDHGVQSGMSTVIGSADRPWGILGTHDTETREFSEQDVNFLESVANVLATAVERNRRVQEIEAKRQHLAALDNLNGVVQDINVALAESSTREEIERAVCERIVDAEKYAFAWVGEVDRSTEEVVPSAWAGEGESYLDDLTISIDDSETALGPSGRAVEELAMQTTPDFEVDDAMEPWRDAAAEHGFRSSASIPLVYEGALYGVLNVYSGRPGAFEGREGEVVAQLSEVVGHAIRAVERKEALMSESVVQLEFRSGSYPAPLLDLTADGGALRFERTVQTNDGSYLQYVALEGVSESAFRDAVASWDVTHSPRLVTDHGDGPLFEVTLENPPATSTVASHGGQMRRTVVADGELEMEVEVPHSVDIRTLVGALEGIVPDVELVSQRSRQRDEELLGRSAVDALTDKQLAAVEAAFHAGYFEWPRESTAEELAESIGVSAPTLHQHLRKGERKLLAGYFSG